MAPVFPIRVDWDGNKEKWHKRPLTRHGHKDASQDVSVFDWSYANGYGIVMGHGLYALDLDTYKPGCQADQWFAQWRVPRQTRIHQTISGAQHLIYRTPAAWHGLRSRQNIVPGLDSRGAGGWLAFGEGYRVLNETSPAELPEAVCVELGARSQPTRKRQVTPLMPVSVINPDDVLKRLQMALAFGRVSFRRRWHGDPGGLKDTSASGWDMSAAKLLAFEGFRYDEIHWLLATQFQHGVVARDGFNEVTDRALKRCAARATQNSGVLSAKLQEAFGHG